MQVTHDYLTVYQSNASAIGLLPAPLAMDVARFYTQIKSLLEDVRSDLPAPVTAEEAEYRLIQQIELLTETVAIGENLVEKLRKEAK